jgi:carbon storage regulator
MLILSRKPNEQILIGENVVITVVAVSGGHVRLGIEAPREIPIHRKEVFEALNEGGADPSQAREEHHSNSPPEGPAQDEGVEAHAPPDAAQVGHSP